MISVCMATYNGEEFVIRQLETIVKQLVDEDEIIIIDDCSTDGTINLIKEKYGSRIQIVKNQVNSGPIKSFEKAVQMAKGNYIFLSDQDDLWLDNKVEMVMNSFQNENADIIVHDSVVVDGDLNRLSNSWNSLNKNNLQQGLIGNLKKNAYTGCMMAFKKEMVNLILPIPEKVEMHDQWIALVAIMEHKKIIIIEEPLMKYVRHGGNVTAINKRTLKKQLKGRFNMLREILNYRRNRNNRVENLK